MGLGWFGAPEHNRWLAAETHALLRFARAARVPAGFGWIGEDGRVDTSHPVELWITGRMTFAFSLGTLMGIPGCRRYSDHGVRTLSRVMRDTEHGGWHSAVGHELDAKGRGVPVDPDGRKECYQHAFVLLAAATATAADRPGAHRPVSTTWDDGSPIPEPPPEDGWGADPYAEDSGYVTADEPSGPAAHHVTPAAVAQETATSPEPQPAQAGVDPAAPMAPQASPALANPADPDDGWGPVAIPGGGSAPAPVSAPAAGGTDPDDGWGPVAVPGGGTVPAQSAPASTPSSPPPGASPSSGAPATPAPTDPQAAPAPAPASAPAASASPAQSRSAPAAQAPDEAPLATVHRLRALPEIPGGAASAPAAPQSLQQTPSSPSPQAPGAGSVPVTTAGSPGLAPVTWEGTESSPFSPGPAPEEPSASSAPPEDESTWAPSGIAGSRLAAAMAAARAAAQDADTDSLADDTPSEDDPDAEDAGVVGLEVVKRVLGAQVIEEVTVTQEGR